MSLASQLLIVICGIQASSISVVQTGGDMALLSTIVPYFS